MRLNENVISYYYRIVLLVFTTSLFVTLTSFSQFTDSSGRVLLASVTLKETPAYIIREANVIFPEILKGNEALSLAYIEKFSNNKRNYLVRMYTRGKKLLPKAAAILKKYKLPQELNVLLPLESAYNPNAVSKAGAVGYWQFMDVVAKEYGLKWVPQITPAEKAKLLKQDKKKAEILFKNLAKQRDDRTNFLTASNAAARYLKDRKRNLNDNWLLVVASYNCGVGNVWTAMEKSGKANPSFWDIRRYLPEETQTYVMNFITMNVIFHNYDKFIKNELVFTPEKIYCSEFDQRPPADYSETPAFNKQQN